MHCSSWYASKYYCNYHVGEWSSHTKEVSHLFLCHTWGQVDIVITKDGFWTLVDIVIADLTRTNLVQCALTTTTHATTIVPQNKAPSYIEWTLKDDFIPLAIKTYGSFHPHFDFFFISYVHANIAHHQWTSLVPLMFIFYYRQRMSIALQHA